MKTNTIITGDSAEVLKSFPDGCIDLIITSPPYNLGNNHHTGNIRHNPYDDCLPESEYQDNQIVVLNELFRVLKPEGSLLYNHKNRIKDGVQISPYQWIFRTNFICKQEIVWFNGSQNFDKIRFYPMTERVYWLAKSPKTKLFNAINHHDLFRKDEWKAQGTRGKHTRAFPEKFVEDMLLCFPNAEIVLDPYCGSGTTLSVSKKMNRKYIGIDISAEYVALTNERLAQLERPNTASLDDSADPGENRGAGEV